MMTNIKQKEILRTSHIIESIRKYSTEKITDRLIEQYHEAASSKEFTTDKVLLDLNRKSQHQIKDKYIFVIEDIEIAISEKTINYIRENKINIVSVEDIVNILKESKYG